MPVRLHVNIDHVATLRQARGVAYPSPVDAARLCEGAGAHGITVHLREDRRHIQDADVRTLRGVVTTMLNLEMAATDEMVAIAKGVRPDMVTLVPEKREERTTEGGLDVVGNRAHIEAVVRALKDAGIRTSLFIDPEEAQVRASKDVGADGVELHTGDYAHAAEAHQQPQTERELARLSAAAVASHGAGLALAAGHGLTAANTVALVRSVPHLEELNIGHALVADAVMVGMPRAVLSYLAAIAEGEALRNPGGA